MPGEPAESVVPAELVALLRERVAQGAREEPVALAAPVVQVVPVAPRREQASEEREEPVVLAVSVARPVVGTSPNPVAAAVQGAAVVPVAPAVAAVAAVARLPTHLRCAGPSAAAA